MSIKLREYGDLADKRFETSNGLAYPKAKTREFGNLNSFLLYYDMYLSQKTVDRFYNQNPGIICKHKKITLVFSSAKPNSEIVSLFTELFIEIWFLADKRVEISMRFNDSEFYIEEISEDAKKWVEEYLFQTLYENEFDMARVKRTISWRKI